MNKLKLIYFVVLMMLASAAFAIYAADTATQTKPTEFGNVAQSLPFYLTRSTTAEKAPDDNGFIQRWLLLEPIRQLSLRSNQQLTDSFVQAAVKKEYFPDQFTVIPHDGDKVTVDGTELKWYAVDTSRFNVNLFSFASVLNKPTYNVLFWQSLSSTARRK